MADIYRIHDEPEATDWQHLVVDPMWPLLAVMLAGTWLSWPWFIANALALGSPTRRREIALAGAGFAVTLVMAAVLLQLIDREVLESELVIRLCALGIFAWKLGVSYTLHQWQSRTFHIYASYAGAVRSGLAVLAMGAIFGRPLVLDLVDSVLWRIIVGGGWV